VTDDAQEACDTIVGCFEQHCWDTEEHSAASTFAADRNESERDSKRV
jgi:hypothetical protein